MSVPVYLIADCNITVWGLTPAQRLERTVGKMDGARLAGRDEPWPDSGPVLLLRGDYLYDERVLRGLLERDDGVLLDPRDGSVVAARADAGRWGKAPNLNPASLAELPRRRPETVASGLQSRLLKFDTPWVAPVTRENRARLEKALFGGAYKGVTDFITRGVWPVPARWATRGCVKLGVNPNQVTALSYVLAVLAGWWFWQGDYGLGLLAAWIMTFLDTVDGKLARVTLTSSRFGDIFDHALDLVHPPFWYLAWGIGLGASWQFGISMQAVFWAIVLGYLAGRLCELVFDRMAGFSMFIWRPFDSFNRLVTARRNPNLLILTLAWLAGSSGYGLLLVAAWTLISTLILSLRTGRAVALRTRGQQLQSWLHRVNPQTKSNPLAIRLFAGSAAGPAHV